MFYSLLVGLSIITVVLTGFILGTKDTIKNRNTNAHLNKLDNSDPSCGEAFQSLELSNAWGDVISERKRI